MQFRIIVGDTASFHYPSPPHILNSRLPCSLAAVLLLFPVLPPQPVERQQAMIRECFTLISKRSDRVCNFLEDVGAWSKDTKLVSFPCLPLILGCLSCSRYISSLCPPACMYVTESRCAF